MRRYIPRHPPLHSRIRFLTRFSALDDPVVPRRKSPNEKKFVKQTLKNEALKQATLLPCVVPPFLQHSSNLENSTLSNQLHTLYICLLFKAPKLLLHDVFGIFGDGMNERESTFRGNSIPLSNDCQTNLTR